MSIALTPLQRFTTAAGMGTPDQVPCMPFLTGHFFAWFNGMDEGDYWFDPVKKLTAQLAVQDLARLDAEDAAAIRAARKLEHTHPKAVKAAVTSDGVRIGCARA